MEVFISWSGPRSKAVAQALKSWLRRMLNYLKPWMSEEDIPAGARWAAEIHRRLNDCNYGILVLTRDNFKAPWILFEAGALAKKLDESRVCPYLVLLAPEDIPQGPLSLFQSKPATREGTLDLVRSLNNALGDDALTEKELESNFDLLWPELEAELNRLPPETQSPEHRSPEDKIDEILLLVRSLSTQIRIRSNRDRLAIEGVLRRFFNVDDETGEIWIPAHSWDNLPVRAIRELRRRHSQGLDRGPNEEPSDQHEGNNSPDRENGADG